jgi:predicted dehydrogenase
MAQVHAAHIEREPDVVIAAASDHGSGRAQRFALQWGAQAFTDWRRLLDETPLDAVYICTPTASHAEIALACVERGLHLFVEKPLDLDLRRAAALERRVRQRGVVALTAFQWRYCPAFARAAQWIGDEPVGLVSLRWYWTRPPIRWMWDRTQAGGQIVDQNIHLLDLSRALAGEVDWVFAAYNERQTNFEPDFHNWDNYALTLGFASGAVGSCVGSYSLYPQVEDRPMADFCLRDRIVRITDHDATHLTSAGSQSMRNNEALHRGVNHAFIEAVRRSEPSLVITPLAEGMRSTALALAANESARTGARVHVADFLRRATGEVSP